MPIASALSRCLPQSFFARPAEVVAPELIGCLLGKRQAAGELLWGVIVETEAYSQEEPACHGYRRRSPSNETLFGEPGRFYVYVSYGIHHCVNVTTCRADWANGVLLRAVAMPGEPERVAPGPPCWRADLVSMAVTIPLLWIHKQVSGWLHVLRPWILAAQPAWYRRLASGSTKPRSSPGVGICPPAAALASGPVGIERLLGLMRCIWPSSPRAFSLKLIPAAHLERLDPPPRA